MKEIFAFVKSLNLQKVLIVFVAGMFLFLSTACSNENMTADRQSKPNDIAVQAGANNNPYTMGTDSHGDYVPPSNYGNRAYSNNQHSDASMLPNFNQLVATSVAGQDTSGLLYETSEQRQGGRVHETRSAQNSAYQPAPIPAERQPIINRTNPDEHIMEGIGKQFKEATEFLTEYDPGMIQKTQAKTNTGHNSAVGRQSEQDD